jgi:hypothetical protein
MLTVIVMNSCFVSSAQIVSARLVRGVAPDGPSLMWVIFKTTAPYFFIARLKNAQVDGSLPQVPLRFISDGIPHSWRERWVDARGPFRTELRGKAHTKNRGFPHLKRGKALFVLCQAPEPSPVGRMVRAISALPGL